MPPKKTVQLKQVCLCSSYRCSTNHHLDSEGSSSPGVILSHRTVQNHCLANQKGKLATLDIPTQVDKPDPNLLSDREQSSLLCDFGHLVSLVNIGLKRTINSELIAKYQHHLRSYLQSIRSDPGEHFLWNDSWVGFSRLVMIIVLSTGEYEITFLKSLGRLRNLRVLLASDHLPGELGPSISQLQALCKPPKFQSCHFDPSPKIKFFHHQFSQSLMPSSNIRMHWEKLHLVESSSFLTTQELQQKLRQCKVPGLCYQSIATDPIQYTSPLSQEPEVIHISEMSNHSAWFFYSSGDIKDSRPGLSTAQEISRTLDQGCIVLVSLNL
ncbi:hypothetical protein MJO29_013791 [Puccinia striiformis f. sp. tritici]|nr:hypothetical protein MJO29_013791 [Puccinia striiformis f. sp. tritici]